MGGIEPGTTLAGASRRSLCVAAHNTHTHNLPRPPPRSGVSAHVGPSYYANLKDAIDSFIKNAKTAP